MLALFAREEYEASIRVFEGVLGEDPMNLMVTVRLAVAYSILGNEQRAMQLFARAEQIHPARSTSSTTSPCTTSDSGIGISRRRSSRRCWSAMPQKLPALEALARIRENQRRFDEAARLMERVVVLKESPAADWVQAG